MQHLLIYTSVSTPRLKFIFTQVFGVILKTDFRLTNDTDEFIKYEGAKLTYAEKPLSDELFFFSTQLLFEKGITDQQITVFDWEETCAFFGTHPKYAFPFDVFAASFYLISRYEEYLPHIKDEHERFIPSQSLAMQKNFLHKPLVDIWAKKLSEKIVARFPDFRFPAKKFRHISTIDVDSAYSYKEKGVFRTTGAYLRSLFNLDFQDIIRRTQVLLGIEHDPFDTFSDQLALQKKYKMEMIYFFLVGDYYTNDKNIPLDSSKFQQLIKSVADYAAVGIHPSYASNTYPGRLKKELSRLSSVLNRDITQSRQHFLKMNFPHTYRKLIDLDILEDHTLGYASETGFRASTCTPFLFYDLDTEQETKLKLFPFALMDGTLKDALKLSPEEAITRSKKLADEVKNVNGVFITLWHNHSFDESGEWKGWKMVYEEIARYCFTLRNS